MEDKKLTPDDFYGVSIVETDKLDRLGLILRMEKDDKVVYETSATVNNYKLLMHTLDKEYWIAEIGYCHIDHVPKADWINLTDIKKRQDEYCKELLKVPKINGMCKVYYLKM